MDGEISGSYAAVYTFSGSKAAMLLHLVENFGVWETYMIFLRWHKIIRLLSYYTL